MEEKINKTTKTTKASKPKQKQIKNTDMVTVMNTTNGRVIYQSKRTGQEWVFSEYGQSYEIEFSELVAMNNTYRSFLRDPWLLIVDDSAYVDKLGLTELYKTVFNPEQVEKFFTLPVDKMKELLSKAPIGMKELIASKAQEKITNGTFDSMSKIKFIQESLNVDFGLDV